MLEMQNCFRRRFQEIKKPHQKHKGRENMRCAWSKCLHNIRERMQNKPVNGLGKVTISLAGSHAEASQPAVPEPWCTKHHWPTHLWWLPAVNWLSMILLVPDVTSH